MHHKYELPQIEEPYNHHDEVEKYVATIKRHILSVRNYLDGRRQEIVKELRTKNGQSKDAVLAIKKIYDRVLDELMHIEQMYKECLVRVNVEFSTEARDRLQPPSRAPMAQIEGILRDAFKCCDTALERVSGLKETWTNVPEWIFQETIDVPSESDIETLKVLDETDLEFTREMADLRAKMFSVSEGKVKLRLDEGASETSVDIRRAKTKDFVEAMKRHDPLLLPVDVMLAEVRTLRFVDGEFAACEAWSRVLDARGKQLRSKWLLVFCPQVERIMMKRRMHTLHLNSPATFAFLSSIRENGFDFLLTREDLLPLLEDFVVEAPWLTSWSLQFRTIEGRDIAATLIQAMWRGYWLRQRIRESERRYVAASVLWFAWVSLLKTRQLQQRYLDKVQASLTATRVLSSAFSDGFNRFITEPHVILHLPSLGHPRDIRQTIHPKAFAIRQNIMCLRASFVRNPHSEVIYVLPIRPSEDLLSMYRDVVDSVDPEGAAVRRITYVALSEAKTFERRSMNVSRILHCSEPTLEAIRRKITGRPAYVLPWIVDDCDVRLADRLGLPMLGPDMELQRELLNFSRMSEIIEHLGLPQPAHARNIRDYKTMCDSLAELISINTEICCWLIRLNRGVQAKHCAAFLINHISVPFMPLLRKERAKFGDEWKADSALRAGFLDTLRYQLPKVVFRVSKLSSYYASWRDFYKHVQKYGCLLQAVPDEKNASTVAVSLFVPGLATGDEPKWIGTADKMHFDDSFVTFAYMLPQTSTDSSHFAPMANKFARAMQERGYLGYLTVDFYCYPNKHEEDVVVVMLDVHLYYCLVQQYIDWVKFAICGRYNKATNTLSSDVVGSSSVRKEKSSSYARSSSKWNETSERYAIAIAQLQDDRFTSYSWPQLKIILENCGIFYDSTTKEGCHLLLHGDEIRNSAMFIVISASMNDALTATHKSLSWLHHAIRTSPEERPDTNLPEIVNFFTNLSLKYRNFSADQCL